MNLEQKFDWKIRKLERAYDIDPHNPELALRLAELYFQKGYYLGKGDDWFELSIERVSEAIDRGLVNSEACTLLANALYGRHEYETAGESYRRALELDPKNALAYVGLGNLEKKRNDYPKARELYQKAAEISPTLWQAHYNLGGAYYQEAKARGFQDSDTLLEKAIFHLIRALRLKPFENFIGNIQKDLGELFLHTRQYTHARKFFSRLTRHERYAAMAHYYLGMSNYALGKYTLAIQNYRNYLKHEPASAVAYSKIGLTFLELKNYAKAREACEQALEIEPDNILALFTIGCSYLDERNHERAQETFNKVLEVAPDYFPAYVELVKTHYYSKDYDWLFKQLDVEVKEFENTEGYDGGREYYRGVKGWRRRRIDVLLAQLRELGSKGFPVLLGLLEQAQTDSLKFQLWDDLYDLSRAVKVAEITNKLKEPERYFSKNLGRTIVLLSQYLPEELLVDAFRAEEERLKKAALNRVQVKDDIGEYMKELDRTRAEYREFQGYLLRALAVKGTEQAENFLQSALNRPERSLRISAAVALVYYGNERAIDLLEQECAFLEGEERERVLELIQVGKVRYADLNKVIRLTDLYDRSRGREPIIPRREDPRSVPTTCAVCGKGQREVERMLAGSKLMLCTGCVLDLWRERDFIRSAGQKDVYCSFCRKSIYEVDAFYSKGNIHMCNLCLDLCMGVLEKEEVDRFLQEFP